MTMSSHESPRMGTDVWLTPPEMLARLGRFDLDPCSPAVRPWATADYHISLPEDGLSAEWGHARVWLNPPFGQQAVHWLRKMAVHPGGGIALIPARTETRMFFECIWERDAAVLFWRGRPSFHHADGTKAKANIGAPICLVAWTPQDADVLRSCARLGLGALR